MADPFFTHSTATDRLTSTALLLGRILLSPIFIFSGVMKAMNWSATADKMTAEGMLAVPLFLLGAIVIELGGGLLLLLGYKARVAALALAVFLIPTTLIFHDFWVYEGEAMQAQMQQFMKNLTILGGLLAATAAGPGRFSLDSCCRVSSARISTWQEVQAQERIGIGSNS